MKLRKFMALGLVALLTMSQTIMAFATDTTDPELATGNTSGDGSLEGYVDTDVFTVTLPTAPTVDFKLDPQELLLVSAPAATLDGSVLATGYGNKILFADQTNYTTESASLDIVNKSTFSVDVTVNAKLSGLTKEDETNPYDIKVLDSTAEAFEFGDDTAIAMNLTTSAATSTNGTIAPVDPAVETTTALTDAADGVTVVSTVDSIDDIDTAYEIKYADSVYSYGLKDDVSAVPFKAVSLSLSGTLNDKADWTNFSKDADPSLRVDITYSVAKHVDYVAPTNVAPTFTTGEAVGTISYDNGVGDDGLASITSITMVNNGTAFDGYNSHTSWKKATDDGSLVTFDSAFIDYYKAKGETVEATVYYKTNAGDDKTATVNVKVS